MNEACKILRIVFWAGVIGTVGMIFIGFLYYTLFIPYPVLKPGQIVRCGDYEKITDRYVVPGPENHIVVNSQGMKIDLIVRSEDFSKYQIGKYANFPNPYIYTLQELNETESGYRDACRVISYV